MDNFLCLINHYVHLFLNKIGAHSISLDLWSLKRDNTDILSYPITLPGDVLIIQNIQNALVERELSACLSAINNFQNVCQPDTWTALIALLGVLGLLTVLNQIIGYLNTRSEITSEENDRPRSNRSAEKHKQKTNENTTTEKVLNKLDALDTKYGNKKYTLPIALFLSLIHI